MKGSLLLAVLLAAGAARAEPLTIGVHLVSQHLPAREGQNNVNPGLYVRADGWTVGGYHNTYSETTVYAAHTLTAWRGLEVVGGIAYGYQYHTVAGREYGASRGAFTPMAGLTYAPPLRVLGLQPRIWILPPTPKNSGVVHLSMEF
jgi:hypothetical protein